jgi:tRNA pseudouridine38-40 synthase
VVAAFELAQKQVGNEAKDKLTPMEASNIMSESITPEVLEDARSKLSGFRTTPDQIKSLRAALKVFEGTHPFHNYTRRLSANDPSASRYIMSFMPLDPIIVPGTLDDDGVRGEESEWIPVQVVGQSFLLNQIR